MDCPECEEKAASASVITVGSDSLPPEVVAAIQEALNDPDSRVRRERPVLQSEPRFRVGRHLGRTIYDRDCLIGMMDDRDMAQIVVNALNEGFERLQAAVCLAAPQS